jgi:hypothetical protein
MDNGGSEARQSAPVAQKGGISLNLQWLNDRTAYLARKAQSAKNAKTTPALMSALNEINIIADEIAAITRGTKKGVTATLRHRGMRS